MQDPTQFREQQHLNCPRCKSSNTKFCYYNNYNLTQPRHFCKTCKRYWTKGGTLRNIPVGGVSRKTNTKRSSNPKRSLSPPSPASVIGTQYQSKPEQVESGLVQGSRSLDLNEGFSSLLTPSEQFTKLLVELNTIRSSTAALAENPISSSESNMIRTEFGSSENTERFSVEDSSCYLSFSTPGSVNKVVNYL